MFSREDAVSRVHFGVIYKMQVSGSVRPNMKERSIESGGMVSIDSLIRDETVPQRFEAWSRLLIPHLEAILDA